MGSPISGNPHFWIGWLFLVLTGRLGHCCQSRRRLSIPPLSGQRRSNGRVFSETSPGVCGRGVLDCQLDCTVYCRKAVQDLSHLSLAGECYLQFLELDVIRKKL